MTVAVKPTLKLGDEGIHVNDLQSMLWILGYLNKEYITSVFDFPTEHAVKTFQSAWGLRIDGIVGPETWATLEVAVEGGLPPGRSVWDWIREHKVVSFAMLGLIGVCVYLAFKK